MKHVTQAPRIINLGTRRRLSDELHVPAALSLVEEPRYDFMESWVGLSYSGRVHACRRRRKFLLLYRNQIILTEHELRKHRKLIKTRILGPSFK